MDYRFIKGTRPRLLVFFHGTGGDKESMLFLRQQLNPEAFILSLDGSWGQGRKRRFFAPLIDGQLDLVDVKCACRLFWIFGRTQTFSPTSRLPSLAFQMVPTSSWAC